MPGSPPRMRGKGVQSRDKRVGVGITPAYAGKSKHEYLGLLSFQDHPRVCGEKLRLRFMERTLKGSPPRMRGKGRCRPPVPPVLGITPACAGKRMRLFRLFRPTGDHPRVCGEECQPGPRSPGWVGSPPRMRGRVSAGATLPRLGGITPAYAGKSFQPFFHPPRWRDHPRVCGEEHHPTQSSAGSRGSPPRMRGRAVWKDIKHAEQGITPAYAGKRDKLAIALIGAEDHPRVCGEEDQTKYQLTRGQGSPPRMRGRVGRVLGQLVGLGITPAYAGKSYRKEVITMTTRDHPRVCGEELYAELGPAQLPGSPPRMRGRAGQKAGLPS